MAQQRKVLVIGRHASMLSSVLTLLKNHGYDAIGKLTDEEAIKVFKSEKIEAVIIGGGVEEESRILFHQEFVRINPEVKVIDAHPQTVLKDLADAFIN